MSAVLKDLPMPPTPDAAALTPPVTHLLPWRGWIGVIAPHRSMNTPSACDPVPLRSGQYSSVGNWLSSDARWQNCK